MRPCVFLDRDGTLIKNKHYLKDPEGVEVIRGVYKALCILKKKGYYLIVVSNQSGIGRGLMTEDDVSAVNARLQEKIKKNCGFYLDAFYWAPYYEKAKKTEYRKGKNFRKPQKGMIKKAQRDFNIDLKKSFIIGDNECDILLGSSGAVKIPAALVGSVKSVRHEIIKKAYKSKKYKTIYEFVKEKFKK